MRDGKHSADAVYILELEDKIARAEESFADADAEQYALFEAEKMDALAVIAVLKMRMGGRDA